MTNAINQRIADGTVDGVMADNVKALDLAERYARAHQDVFRRSFVGKLDRQTPVGAEAIFEEEARQNVSWWPYTECARDVSGF